MDNEFRVTICSDLDYEEMVADIYWNNQSIAMVTQEHGIEKMEVEIYSPENLISWKLPLNGFIKALTEAQNILIKMQKLPEDSE